MAKLILPRSSRQSLTGLTALRKRCSRGNRSGVVALFSTSARQNGYEDTINNIKIGKHTRVIYQGFTGRQATANAKESIEYGTNVVGGIKPGFEGEHLGLPVLPSVRAAVEQLKPDASAIYVPGSGTVAAMEEAIENEIPLIVAVAEHIPLHDIMRVHQMLRTQSKTRLVGANCPGMINTQGRCRIGFMPLPFFKEGNVGIIGKSGTLTYEAVASTTRAGLGQSYGIGIGGDVIVGTNFVEACQVLVDDPYTEGIVLIGELGGRAELEAAEWIKDYRARTANPKPVIAVIGGITAPPGKIMGHAGAWCAPGEATAAEKIKLLEKADIEVVDHPEKLGERMKEVLAQQGKGRGSSNNTNSTTALGSGIAQKRMYHTARWRPRPSTSVPNTVSRSSYVQKRKLYIKQSQAFDILHARGILTGEPQPGVDRKMVAVSIDRSHRQPCIVASPTVQPEQTFSQAKRFPFAYGTDEGTSATLIDQVCTHLDISEAAKPSVAKLIKELVDLYMSKEAFIQVQVAKFGFDDAAFRSSKRQADIHALRDTTQEVPEEVAGEQAGMVYIKYDGAGTLGTIVNGAGLAMNTVDNIISRGGSPANFIDTGGKATSDTIKAAFRIVTSDPRVRAIFVNIFGGLTLGDMIANGILAAFSDLHITVPVVVRIRGTNEAKGLEIIRQSGLKLDAYDSFEEAVTRAIALADGTSEPDMPPGVADAKAE
ncbi:hypothetical protein DV738_g2827, partial [Chaetothyriales sp. CBS 135597]